MPVHGIHYAAHLTNAVSSKASTLSERISKVAVAQILYIGLIALGAAALYGIYTWCTQSSPEADALRKGETVETAPFSDVPFPFGRHFVQMGPIEKRIQSEIKTTKGKIESLEFIIRCPPRLIPGVKETERCVEGKTMVLKQRCLVPLVDLDKYRAERREAQAYHEAKLRELEGELNLDRVQDERKAGVRAAFNQRLSDYFASPFRVVTEALFDFYRYSDTISGQFYDLSWRWGMPDYAYELKRENDQVTISVKMVASDFYTKGKQEFEEYLDQLANFLAGASDEVTLA